MKYLSYSDPDKSDEYMSALMNSGFLNSSEIGVEFKMNARQWVLLHVNMSLDSLSNGIRWAERSEDYENAGIMKQIIDFKTSDRKSCIIKGVNIMRKK